MVVRSLPSIYWLIRAILDLFFYNEKLFTKRLKQCIEIKTNFTQNRKL